MTTDETDLLTAIAGGDVPADAAFRLGTPAMRLAYLLNKWLDLGWYEFGPSPTTGTLTPAGQTAAAAAGGGG